ncbi:hypothetical protein [Trichococcus pasteurii]|uniref:Uncharacterized protein n=1 Tax=Trichococcus pasteurii TaxID=43064 RepID=A0A1W1IEW3_9LACT|nr:hypothetical protein [Trichococcus pasteurii]SFE15583.1 hypothetical protein SAMN04488086_101398 [Trichococcus pasteurii]SLM51530.1 Hypothetical protein TPAS_1206 [Trichococcus pasteurii]SSB92411.1 Hypothetical protein TPAS_1206 [Trichococcus pasteurii]
MNVQSWIVLLLFMSLMGYVLFRQIRLIASGRKKCNACTVTVCPMNEPAQVEAEADCIAGTALMVQLGVVKEDVAAEKHCPTSQIIK